MYGDKQVAERERIVQAIMDTIQKIYGDATQTVLDRAAAEAVWKRLLADGVAPPSGVAMIVAAAGGEVTISDDLALDPPTEYFVMDEPFLAGKVLRTKATASA